jgi:hypothetical protein
MKALMVNPQQAKQVVDRAWMEVIKPMTFAGHRMVLEVKEATRSLEQNAKFHALCDDIAKSGHKWLGKARTAAQWKVLLVSGHAVATGEGSDIMAGLEGEFINLRESTALMSVKRGSSLIEYTLAYCAQNEIRLPAVEYA